MAAAVLNGVVGTANHGSQNVEIVNITSWNNGDTYTSEWASVAFAIYVPNTSGTGATVTWANNIVTQVSSGSTGGTLLVFS